MVKNIKNKKILASYKLDFNPFAAKKPAPFATRGL